MKSVSIVFFATQEEFRNWLAENHKSEKELVVGFYKVGTGKQSLSWSESVDEALCFGWIDGIRKSVDNESYCIRFTPRKKSSIWSAVNIKKMEELTNTGKMTAEGLKAFSFRTEKKSNIYAYETKAQELDFQYEEQFKKNTIAWSFFIKQAPSYKKTIIHWLMSAKQEQTRQQRLEKLIKESEEQKRLR